MAYKQSRPRVDIRHYTIPKVVGEIDHHESPASESVAVVPFNPSKDIRLILALGLPLFGLITVGYYFDGRNAWVVPLAERLFALGK